MGILKKTMSVLVLVFFVASLTATSASAGIWNNKCDCDWKNKCDCDWKNKCDCHKDKCDCHKDKCDCHKDKCKCDDFDFNIFFKYFFGEGCFFGGNCNWFGDW